VTEKKSSKGKAAPDALVIPPGHAWDKAWMIAAGVGAVALLVSGAGYASDHKRFAFSYLFAFEVLLSVGLGSMFFVLMQHLTSAGWSVTVRRTAEFFTTGLFALIVLFAPIYVLKDEIFPWLHEGGHGAGHEVSATHTTAAQAGVPAAEPLEGHETAPAHGEHGEAAPGGEEHGGPHAGHGGAHGAHPMMVHGGNPAMHGGPLGDPHEVEEHHVLEAKKPYLNVSFFSIRAVVYLLVWGFLAWRLFRYSVDQDASKDPKLTVAVQRFAPPATILFALTLTFAGFDWIMSLEPTWFSTIFGVYCFAGSVLAGLTTLTLATMAMRRSGLVTNEINTEHYHDLGKLTFGFLVFWAYIGFSQFMLIWYAALPEETTFFHHRWDAGPWSSVSLALLFAHFVFPFFLLLSRNTKRRLQILGFGAAWVLAMHVVDIYWLVMPNFGQDGFAFHWMDATCLIGIGGLYLAVVFHFMRKHRLIPVGDPRLLRAIHFENA
jgi:hypothetical protein